MRRGWGVLGLVLWVGTLAFAADGPAPVEINADEVQYSVTDSKVTATGHVIVQRSGITLTCDRLEFDRGQNVGIAEGHVVFIRQGSRLTGEKMVYNFANMQGEFIDAKVTAQPLYGAGRQIAKPGENQVILTDGYLTTCDLDKPHFCLKAKKVDIVPGEKAVAHNVKMMLGKIPVLWLPFYAQDLKHKKPMLIFTPGYDKRWGMFVLTQWRHYWNDDVNTVLHVDERSRNGIGEGLDLNYSGQAFGSGFMRMYYINDQQSKRKLFFDNPNPPADSVSSQERYKLEWRNKWKIDDHADAIWQFYKLKDPDFLKDFFKKEYENDTNPPTYFLMTRGIREAGTLSFRSDLRVNDFDSAINRLPEINYILPSKPILGTNFYMNDNTSFSNLVKLNPSPDGNEPKTVRFDTDNQVTYPFKLSIFKLEPFVGGRETYYSKGLVNGADNSIRGIFKTGAGVSTKFFRVFDVQSQLWGMNINRLRHVLTPSIVYFYTHDPTVASSKLVQFDGVDNQVRGHGMTFGLENKLQTKQDGKSADLLRLLLTSDFYLKEDLNKGGFNNVKSQMDIRPNSRFSLYAESQYDTVRDRLDTANFDLVLRDPKDRWTWALGKRFDLSTDDQVTTQVDCRLNPKWSIEIYQRWDVRHGQDKEQGYSFVRDLHEWQMKLTLNHKDTDGDSIWIVFTLKEFPDLSLDFGSGFNRVKAGSQSH